MVIFSEECLPRRLDSQHWNPHRSRPPCPHLNNVYKNRLKESSAVLEALPCMIQENQ